MTSLVFLFSKFTSEALFIEAALICMLCIGYATFWILNKRKYGVIDQDVPGGVVKDYLAHLIVDAEHLKVQLFGLLNSAHAGGAHATFTAPSLNLAGAGTGAGAMSAEDPAFAEKLKELEAKLAEKEAALNGIVAEKERITSELQNAKEASNNAGGGDNSDLLEKIKMLEARLAEYSVIEDDLANLKRLQQENTQLKQQLQAAGSATPAAAVAAAAPVAEAPAADSSNVDALFDAALTDVPTPEPAAPAAAADTSSAVDPQAAVDSMFDSLVNAEAGAAGAEAAPAPIAEAAPAAVAAEAAPETPAPTPVAEKSDEELVAEFEKMLNS